MASRDGDVDHGRRSGGPTMISRIGVMRALNRHHVVKFNPKGKKPYWGRRKLKRDD